MGSKCFEMTTDLSLLFPPLSHSLYLYGITSLNKMYVLRSTSIGKLVIVQTSQSIGI